MSSLISGRGVQMCTTLDRDIFTRKNICLSIFTFDASADQKYSVIGQRSMLKKVYVFSFRCRIAGFHTGFLAGGGKPFLEKQMPL